MATGHKKRIRDIIGLAIEDGQFTEQEFLDASTSTKSALINIAINKFVSENQSSGSIAFNQGDYILALPGKWNVSGTTAGYGKIFADTRGSNESSEKAWVGSQSRGLVNPLSGSGGSLGLGAKFQHWRFASSSHHVSGAARDEQFSPPDQAGRKDTVDFTLWSSMGQFMEDNIPEKVSGFYQNTMGSPLDAAGNVAIIYSPNFPYSYTPKFATAAGLPDNNDDPNNSDLTVRAYIGWHFDNTFLGISASGQTENTSSMNIARNPAQDGLYCQVWNTNSVSRVAIQCLNEEHEGATLHLSGGYSQGVGEKGFYVGAGNQYLIKITGSDDPNHPIRKGLDDLPAAVKVSAFVSSSALYPEDDYKGEPYLYAKNLAKHIQEQCADDFIVRASGSLVVIYTKELGYRGYSTITSSAAANHQILKWHNQAWAAADGTGTRWHLSGSRPLGGNDEDPYRFTGLFQGSGSVDMDPNFGVTYIGSSLAATGPSDFLTTGSVKAAEIICVEFDLSGSHLAGNTSEDDIAGLAIWMSGSDDNGCHMGNINRLPKSQEATGYERDPSNESA